MNGPALADSPTVLRRNGLFRGELMPMKTDFALTPAVIAGTPAPMLPRKEMTIQDLWSILSRRRRIVLGVLLFTIAVTAVLFATSTRLYKGSAVDSGTKGIRRCVEHGHHDGSRVPIGRG